MQSGNPVLSDQLFGRYRQTVVSNSDTMTMNGCAMKCAILLLLTFLTAGFTWYNFLIGNMALSNGLMMGGLIGGFITALVTVFKAQWAPISAPIYALFEGLFLGGISVVFEQSYPGIAFQAVALTFAVLAVMLFIYSSGLVQVTDTFRFGVVAATGGIALVYFVSILLSFFGVSIPFIFGNGLFGILFSFFVVGIAALNLVLDFDLIEKATHARAPKYMEWYGAFALMVTLIWLYIEVLRLLSKMRSR